MIAKIVVSAGARKPYLEWWMDNYRPHPITGIVLENDTEGFVSDWAKKNGIKIAKGDYDIEVKIP